MDAHSKVTKVTKVSQCISYFLWKNDSIWYKDHLYICKNSQLKQKVLFELHTSPIGGQLGFLKILDGQKGFFGNVLNLMFEGLW